jgi:hypothetical protein
MQAFLGGNVCFCPQISPSERQSAAGGNADLSVGFVKRKPYELRDHFCNWGHGGSLPWNHLGLPPANRVVAALAKFCTANGKG